MKKRYYILLSLILSSITVFGQREISDWIDFDSISIKNIKAVSMYKVAENKDEILLERNMYNSRGKVIEHTEYSDDMYKTLDSAISYLYFFDKDSITLLERRIINSVNNNILHQIIYSYTYELDKLVSKTIYDVTDQDFEKENYYYDTENRLVKQVDECFYGVGDSVSYRSNWKFKYDLKGHLMRQSYYEDSDNTEQFAFTYINDSIGNVLFYKFIGLHNCGFDTDRYSIEYNKKSKPILKKSWNAEGTNWIEKFVYNRNNKLYKWKVYQRYQKVSFHDLILINRIPITSGQVILKKRYQKSMNYALIYDSKDNLSKVKIKRKGYKDMTELVFKYE
jgi:hypothetical protein